jgi:hypothetical protein
MIIENEKVNVNTTIMEEQQIQPNKIIFIKEHTSSLNM